MFFYLKQAHYEFVFTRNADELKLIQLVIPKSKKIHWEKKDEIIYDGNYYDVFKKSEDTHNIYLLCYHDMKDNELADALHKNLDERHIKDTENKAAHYISFKLQNYMPPGFCWSVTQPLTEKISIHIFNPTCCGFLSVFTPPPDFVV